MDKTVETIVYALVAVLAKRDPDPVGFRNALAQEIEKRVAETLVGHPHEIAELSDFVKSIQLRIH